MPEQPQGKSMRELRAIVEADNQRFWELGEIWNGLSEAEQRELIETAKLMLSKAADKALA